MSDPKNPDQPELKLSTTSDYRNSYANSVQVRMSVWDFFLVFGTMHQESQAQVAIENFQGIYLSPQQAKALWNVLGHNLAQYEQTFGNLALEPKSETPANPALSFQSLSAAARSTRLDNNYLDLSSFDEVGGYVFSATGTDRHCERTLA